MYLSQGTWDIIVSIYLPEENIHICSLVIVHATAPDLRFFFEYIYTSISPIAIHSGDDRVTRCPNVRSDTVCLSWIGSHGIVWAARAVALASVSSSGVSAAIAMTLRRVVKEMSIGPGLETLA